MLACWMAKYTAVDDSGKIYETTSVELHVDELCSPEEIEYAKRQLAKHMEQLPVKWPFPSYLSGPTQPPFHRENRTQWSEVNGKWEQER